MVEQASGGSYTQILYSPTGGKLALMNGQTLQKAFVPLIGGAEAVYNSAGLSYYRHSDWLGSSRLAVWASSRSVYFDGAYAPFGEPYNNAPGFDFSFTGQNQDTAAGLYDFLFREQSPVQGRWISPDPAGAAAVDIRNPQTWNRYAYLANNPLNTIDLLGLGDCAQYGGDSEPCKPPGAAGGFAGGGGGGGIFRDPSGVLWSLGRCFTFEYGNGEGGIGGTWNFTDCLSTVLADLDFSGSRGASNGLLKFLASCEGFSGTAYADSRGNCTIGYGHLLHLGPCTAADNALSETQQVATNQLRADVNTAATAVNSNLSIPLNQGQFDAIVSLTFNMGMGRLRTHDVWTDVSAGNMAAVPGDIMSLGAGGPGIPARRANE